MNIVILGLPGSGKGTQAELVSKKYDLVHVETGRLLRDIASSLKSPLSAEINTVLTEGGLVSDVILEHVLEEVFKQSNGKGFVFDGTPRNLEQYDLMKRMLESRGEKFDKIILIKTSEEELIKRLSARRICVICGRVYNIVTKPSTKGDLCECGGKLVQREDDKPEIIKKRLEAYHEKTSAVISKAREEGILTEVNGERPIEDIFNDIVQTVSTNFSGLKVN